MSIQLYTGVTGSGKSYHAVEEILNYKRRPVIANFGLTKPRANWDLLLPKNITPGQLIRIALHGHTCYQNRLDSPGRRICKCTDVRWKLGEEGACLLVLEEVSSVFQSREWDRNDRGDWLEFFNHHRKLGYEIILIAQYDKAIDVQIRAVIDSWTEHHKAKHILPAPYNWLAWLIPVPVFMRIQRSYQLKTKFPGGVGFSILSRGIANRYDSFALFNGIEELAGLVGGPSLKGSSPPDDAPAVLPMRRRAQPSFRKTYPDPSELEA